MFLKIAPKLMLIMSLNDNQLKLINSTIVNNVLIFFFFFANVTLLYIYIYIYTYIHMLGKNNEKKNIEKVIK